MVLSKKFLTFHIFINMSSYYPHKKLLIDKVFQKAKQNTHESSQSGILKDLENTLRDELNISLSYKSLETYIKNFLEEDKDYNIPTINLNNLSKYIGFTDFKHFCKKNTIEESPSTKVEVNVTGEKNENHHISDTESRITINVINKPFFGIPEFMAKQSNMGIIGVIIVLGGFGGYKYLEPSSKLPKSPSIQSLFGSSNMKCMYWNGDEYIQENCNKITNEINFINLDTLRLNQFKRITNPDTLTLHSIGKVWYSKYNHKVEFFTLDGKNPNNGKNLRPLTEYILNKYTK